MSSLPFSQLPKWRQVLAIACAAYALLAWALPALMLPLVNILPFVHERDVLERLPISALGSALVVLSLLAVSGARIPTLGEVHGELRQGATFWVGVIAGFAMFTYAAAELSANILGLAARILPSEDYRATVVIDSADYHGSGRRKSVSLEYKDPDTDEPRYLVLSRRLFGNPVFKPGDRVELRGAKSRAGIYVKEFSLLSGERLQQARAPRGLSLDRRQEGSAERGAILASDGTEAYDRGQKLDHYRQVPSLAALVLVSHRSPRIEVWERGSDGAWHRSEFGAAQAAEIRALPARLRVDEIYLGSVS